MRSVGPIAVISALLPVLAWAKTDIRRVEVRVGGFVNVIERQDLARRFSIWNGPGTSSDQTTPQSLADWTRGTVEPPAGLISVHVTVFCGGEPAAVAPCHVIEYCYDERQKRGYVYLPGNGEDGYQLNTRHVLRGVEGRWFHSTREWDALLASRR